MANVKPDVNYMAIESWEGLEEAGIDLKYVLQLIDRKQSQLIKNREKNLKDRAVLKYFREHPEEFEEADV